jgi:hypothetical protein
MGIMQDAGFRELYHGTAASRHRYMTLSSAVVTRLVTHIGTRPIRQIDVKTRLNA